MFKNDFYFLRVILEHLLKFGHSQSLCHSLHTFSEDLLMTAEKSSIEFLLLEIHTPDAGF